MTASDSRVVTCAVAAALALACAGCPKQRSTMDRPPEINPPPPVEQGHRAAGLEGEQSGRERAAGLQLDAELEALIKHPCAAIGYTQI